MHESTRRADRPVPWDAVPLTELVEHVVRRFHDPLRGQLPALIALAERVEREHAELPACPRGLAAHLRAVSEAVEVHLEKEEQILFPLIVSGRGAWAQLPIRVMLQEHEDHVAGLQRTRALTQNLVAPTDASPAWRALYDGLAELESDLHEHMLLENHVLFPRALRS